MPTRYWKGKKFSEEHKKRLSKSHKGQRPWCKGKHWKIKDTSKMRGHIPWNKGLTKKENSHIKGGRKAGFKHTEEWKQKMKERIKKNGGSWLKGTKGILKANSGSFQKGRNHFNWKGGITSENRRIKNSIEFRLWREAIFARDSFTCQKCKEKGIYLHSHHKQNFADYPELRFAIDNGITFCKKCHQDFHKRYGRKNNTKKQIEEFLK